MKLRQLAPLCASLLLILAACGGGGGGGGSNAGSANPPGAVTPPPPPVQALPPGISVLAGAPGGYGNADGPVGRLGIAQALAIDRAGVLYVGNVTNAVGTIRTVTFGAGAEATVATRWTGVEGPPVAVAAEASGNLVAIVGNRIVRIAADGRQTTLAGAWIDGTADGQGEQARFSFPKALAIDSTGLIWVADSQAIRTVTADGEVRTHRAATDALLDAAAGQQGQPVQVRQSPTGLAFDGAGNLVIAVAGANARKLTPAGARQDTALPAGAAIAADRSGQLYAFTSDCVLYKADAAGQLGLLAGSPTRRGPADGAGAEAAFGSGPTCDGRIVTDEAGNLYVTDANVVRKVTPNGIVSTVAGKAPQYGMVDGAGTAARFSDGLSDLSFDGKDSLYLVQELKVRKITRSGVVTTLNLPEKDAGRNPIAYFTGGMAFQGSVIGVASRVVYLVDENGGMRALATLPQETDGNGDKALFQSIRGVARDGAGNFYLLDFYAHRPGPGVYTDWARSDIRKVTPNGAVTTIYTVTNSYVTPDKREPVPSRIVADRQGNVYASTDGGAILRIAASGAASSIPVDQPYASLLAVDGNGNLYLANQGAEPAIVEKIGADGQARIIAGRRDQFGLITGPLPGSLNLLDGMTVDDQGAIYVLTEHAVVRIAQ